MAASLDLNTLNCRHVLKKIYIYFLVCIPIDRIHVLHQGRICCRKWIVHCCPYIYWTDLMEVYVWFLVTSYFQGQSCLLVLFKISLIFIHSMPRTILIVYVSSYHNIIMYGCFLFTSFVLFINGEQHLEWKYCLVPKCATCQQCISSFYRSDWKLCVSLWTGECKQMCVR